MLTYDLVVIGGGPAGLAAAYSAYENGVKNILIKGRIKLQFEERIRETMLTYDLVVIGGGPAGLAAAYSAYENGVKNILIIERDDITGGILNQCIHNGFGLHYFKEELTGPEYAQRFEDMVKGTTVEVMTQTMVLGITPQKQIYAVNSQKGYLTIGAKAIVLSMGCRERTRGAIAIPGDRPAGVFTAGTAQRRRGLPLHTALMKTG